MRYGIFSDVHGNPEALEQVLRHLEAQRVDAYVFLGDAVGYGANPNEVCDLIRPRAKIAIVGNHDAAVCGRSAYHDYYAAARHALDYTQSQLSQANREWLTGLPFKVREGDVEFCHGAPFQPEAFDYLFTLEQFAELPVEELAPLTLIGHSHLTASFRIDDGDVEPLLNARIEYGGSAKHVVTAGSVGQPRDRDPRACCGVLDLDERHFTFHRVPYDVMRARQKIIDAGLAPVFGERLLVGI